MGQSEVLSAATSTRLVLSASDLELVISVLDVELVKRKRTINGHKLNNCHGFHTIKSHKLNNYHGFRLLFSAFVWASKTLRAFLTTEK